MKSAWRVSVYYGRVGVPAQMFLVVASDEDEVLDKINSRLLTDEYHQKQVHAYPDKRMRLSIELLLEEVLD